MKGIKIQWKSSSHLLSDPTDEIGYDATTKKVLINISKRYFRPCEVDQLLGDSSRARTELNWKPNTTFQELVREMVDADTL